MRLLSPALAAAILCLTSCGTDTGQPAAAKSAAVKATGSTLASVNGSPVTEGEFQAWLTQRGVKDISKVSDANSQAALDELTTLTMMAQEAEQRGLAQQAVNELALQRKSLLAEKLLADELARRPISDSAVADEYRRREADMAITQYRARHILVADESKAEALIEQLQSGADFATLAAEHSTEASKAEGGDLGWFELREMVKPFADEVAKLSTGRFSQAPLKTDLGWHIVKSEGNRVVPPPSLEEMEPQLRRLLRAQRIEQFITELKAGYSIELP